MMPRKKKVLAAVASSLFLAVMIAGAAAAAPNPFMGAWYSVDNDTSNQTLYIGGGPAGSHFVRYYDAGATVCGWNVVSGGPGASAQGFLSESGNTLSGSMPVYCLASPRYFWGVAGFVFLYDPGTDTLTDSNGVVWHR